MTVILYLADALSGPPARATTNQGDGLTKRRGIYRHLSGAFTAGWLRNELRGLPDDLPIVIAVPSDGGPLALADSVDDRWVIAESELGCARMDDPDNRLVLTLDLATEYERGLDFPRSPRR